MHVVSASTLQPDELPVGCMQDSSSSLSFQLECLAKAICKAKRVAVVCGAGCSTNAGIPDFRSSTGLFKALKDKHPNAGLSSGKDLFNASLFQSEANTALYYSMIAELAVMSRHAQPTTFHQLLKTLDDQGKLFRVYTQNIDALEAKAGLSFGLPPQAPATAHRGKKRKLDADEKPSQPTARTTFKSTIPRCVPLHGSLQTLQCRKCGHADTLDSPAYIERLAQGQAVPCPSCETAEEVRSVSNYRSRGVGIMKPAVVLYGEPHADADLVGSVTASDLKGARPDLLLVVGTTLKVPGTQRLVSELAKVIHPSFTQNGAADTTTDRPLEKQLSHPKTIFLNAEFPTQAKKWSALFDVWVQSDIQEFAKAVHDVKQSNATSKNKKREPLALGINQVFAASKPTVAAAIPKPQPTGSLLLKSKVSKPSSSKIKKPAAKAPKPGWDYVISKSHNVFESDPVIEGRRPKKQQQSASIIQATLHVRPSQSPPPQVERSPSPQQSVEPVASTSRESFTATVLSSPSSASIDANSTAGSEVIARHLLGTPAKSTLQRQSAPLMSSSSSISSLSDSPSSSEASPDKSAAYGVCISPLSSVEKDRRGIRPQLYSPMKLVAQVDDSKVLPPLHPPHEPRRSERSSDLTQYKVSDYFGAKRGQPCSSALFAKA